MFEKELENKINSIANLIKTHTNSLLGTTLSMSDNGLYSVFAGNIIFLYHYSEYFKDNDSRICANNLLEEIINDFSDLSYTHSYCSGVAGMLSLFSFLKKRKFINIDTSEVNNDINLYLNKKMQDDIDNNKFDFMHGAIGVGLYSLYEDTVYNRDNIQQLINFLYLTAYKKHNSIYWMTQVSQQDGSMNENISLSHGVSSIVVFLSRLVRTGYTCNIVKEMLIKSINYLQSQQVDYDKVGSCFPASSKNDVQKKSRLAWCYGDLGVAIALKEAALALNDNQLFDFAISVFLKNTQRKECEDTMVLDAGICHGSAGIAMIYNRMYIDTNIIDLKTSANFWVNKTLRLATHEDGLCGYKRLIGKKWKKDYSLLTGISGIGLMLMTYLVDDNQDWDELFLLSYNTNI